MERLERIESWSGDSEEGGSSQNGRSTSAQDLAGGDPSVLQALLEDDVASYNATTSTTTSQHTHEKKSGHAGNSHRKT